MKEKAVDVKNVLTVEKLRLAIVFTGALSLYIMMIGKTAFALQFVVFAVTVFAAGAAIYSGFEALSKFEPRVESIVFISTVMSGLHGLSTLSAENYFASSSVAIALLTIGRYVLHGETAETRLEKRLCKWLVSAALLGFMGSLVVNLWLHRGITASFTNAFAVVSASCPLAVTFVSPAMLILCAARLKDFGIEVYSLSAIAKLGEVFEIDFEESGVIFEDNVSLYDVYSVDADNAAFIKVAAAIETYAGHRYASAVVAAAKKLGADVPLAKNYYEISGRGVSAEVLGDKYFLGNKRLLKERKIALPDAVKLAKYDGTIPIFAVKNNEFYGVMFFKAKKKRGVCDMLSAVKSLGIRRALISGNASVDIKKNFDILLCDEEKVLQEKEKGDKIIATVVKRAVKTDADIICSVDDSDFCDICVAKTENVYPLLWMCQMSAKLIRANVIFAFSVAFICIAGTLGVVSSPLMPSAFFAFSSVSLLLSALNSLRIVRLAPPEISTSEEDEMFGKINYTMKIDGMSCAHCSAKVKIALESLKGVSANISLEEKLARIKCPASTNAETLSKAVSDLGFTVVSVEKV